MAEDLFEAKLRALSAVVEWPPTPDLAGRLAGRLVAAPRRPVWTRRRLSLALAAAFLIAISLAVTPPAREAIAGWLGIGHVAIRRVPVLPSPSGPVPAGRKQVSLAEARGAVGFAVRVPPGLVEAVYVVGGPPGGEVQFQLAENRLVTETGGRFDERFLGKIVGPGTDVSMVIVNGHPGVWIHGAPHAVAYLDTSGEFRLENLRIVGDVLLWEEGGVVFRIEGASSQAAALVLATGLR